MSTKYPTSDSVGTVLANAVADVVTEERTVLSDEDSRAIVTEAYRNALHSDQRDQFEAALRELRDDTDQESVEGVIDSGVRDIYQALAQDDVRLIVEHAVSVEFDQREVWLYQVIQGRDPGKPDELGFSSDVQSAVEHGVALLSESRFDDALEHFRSAGEQASTTDDAVASKVLSAWTNHLAGRNERALDFAEEALHLHTGSFTSRLVILVADHAVSNQSTPDSLSAKVYLRTQADVASEGDLQVHILNDREERREGSETEFVPIPSLEAETTIEFTLTGELHSFPELSAYYVALGLVDERRGLPRSVEQVFAQGPETANGTEAVRFEREQ